MTRLGPTLGILLGLGGILSAQWLDHGTPLSLLNPSALLLIVAGTLGATLASTGWEAFRQSPRWLLQALWGARAPRHSPAATD